MSQENLIPDWMQFADDRQEEEYDGDCYGERCGVVGCPSCDREYYENYSECGKLSNGLCMKAGSEECDFECPNR